MKKIISLSMVTLMALSMVACGNSAASTDTQTEEAVQVEEEAVPTADTTAASTTVEDETPISFIKQASEECAPSIDISDCGTFTDILNNNRLSAGMGWTNIDIGSVNCFMVSSGTYDNMDGNMAAIDATIFTYVDGEIVELGKLCSGGTAYPLATKDGYIYAGANHWVCKYVISDNQLQIMEKASLNYDANGDATYFYESEDGGDYSQIDSKQAEEIMNQLYEELGEAEVINFDTVAE